MKLSEWLAEKKTIYFTTSHFSERKSLIMNNDISFDLKEASYRTELKLMYLGAVCSIRVGWEPHTETVCTSEIHRQPVPIQNIINQKSQTSSENGAATWRT